RHGFVLLVMGGLGLAAPLTAETPASPEFKPASAGTYLEEQSSLFQNQAGSGAEACFVLARLQNRLGHQDQAERLARRALESDPKRAEIHSFLGRMFLAEG